MFPVARMLACVSLSAFLVLLAPGCKSAPAKVDITGKVTKDGVPLKVSKTGRILVRFYPEVEKGENYTSLPAEINKETGVFTVKDIPVGKYRIIIQQLDPNPTKDVLEGAFNRNKSRIIREVTGTEPIDIDLAKEAPSNQEP
jgi:hypothetical protein